VKGCGLDSDRMAATALIVPVEEAEQAVGPWRRRYTQDGADGMPAHVTLLCPFVDDSILVAGHVREVEALLGSFEPFDFRLATFAEFPGPPPVLYFEPRPAEPFRAMTEALGQRFPDCPPYGGVFDEIIPHLTIAEGPAAPFAEIQDAVAPAVPLIGRAVAGWLMEYKLGRWQIRRRIRLGAESTTIATNLFPAEPPM
jgi:2'-5' RNA ligase